MTATIKTYWEVWSYDVWGNAEEGYQVNDRYCQDRCYEIELPVLTANAGTEYAFEYAELSPAMVNEALGLHKRLELDGDDIMVTANGESSGKPYGELHCVSHDSLSPIRETPDMAKVIQQQQSIKY